MQYCLSAQVKQEYLKKANEIRVKYNQLDSILDLYEINSKAIFILTITSKEDKNTIRWTEIENYNKMTQDNLIIETDSFNIMDVCKVLNIKFFYAIPINTFYELKSLVDYGCYYIKIDAPLTHMLNKVKNYNIKIRMTPNIAYYAYIPRENGVIGSWVRPEDAELYENYIDVFEFEDCDATKEQALYRIYAEQQKWPGNLNNLITNLNYQGTNRMIPKDFGQIRIFCGQKCLTGTNCKVCYHLLNMADPEKFKKMIEKVNN